MTSTWIPTPTNVKSTRRLFRRKRLTELAEQPRFAVSEGSRGGIVVLLISDVLITMVSLWGSLLLAVL
jgi:hypothetical protein